MRSQHLNAVLLLICCSGTMAAPSPFIQEVANFLTGIRYVPPGDGLFAPTNNPPSPDGYASPSDAYSVPPSDGYTGEFSGPRLVPPAGESFAPTNNPPAPEYSAPKAADYPPTAVTSYGPPDAATLAHNGNWISSAAVPEKEYLLGDRDMTRDEAAAWCAASGSRLAEIPSQNVQQLLASMLQVRGVKGNYWLALRRPFQNWEHSSQRTAGYSDWAGDYLGRQKDCAVFNGEYLHWEVADCGARAGYRALCERERREGREKENLNNSVDVSSEHCVVTGVRITLDNWLNRIERINSTADCHAACLQVARCSFWTWNQATHRCYMKEQDGPVVRDETSHSGTTLHSKGCNRELVTPDRRQSRIEYCSCAVSPDAYLNPRSLPAEPAASGTEDDKQQLGRLVRYTACPFGQELVCTDDAKRPAAAPAEIIESKSPYTKKSNITDCIVYDMKLSGDQNVLAKLRNIADAETCAASCLSTTSCSYWTWRGDLPARTCLLLAGETEAQRRPGTASGTVRKELGCVLRIVQIKQQQEHQEQLLKELREQEELEIDDCTCERDPSYVVAYARSGLPDDVTETEENAQDETETTTADTAELLQGQGRIVNIDPLEAKSLEADACPRGYVRVCAVEKKSPVAAAALWNHPIPPAAAYGRSEDGTAGIEARIGGSEDLVVIPEEQSKAVRFPTD